jgi:hypothetical protein
MAHDIVEIQLLNPPKRWARDRNWRQRQQASSTPHTTVAMSCHSKVQPNSPLRPDTVSATTGHAR